jgi:hypothetical protein
LAVPLRRGSAVRRIQFRQWESEDALAQRYPALWGKVHEERYPLVTVSIDLRLDGFGIHLTESKSVFGGKSGVIMRDSFIGNCATGVQLGSPGSLARK